MESSYPTRRPTDASYLDAGDVDPPPELLDMPWIDPHNHAHTLSWADRERYALGGCRAMVMIASGIHWAPYKPVRADDVRYLWDGAINRLPAIERNHFFEANLAVGIQTSVRVEDPDELLAAMDDYCGLEEVVAIGETGVTPSQHVEPWPIEEQREVVTAEMELAARHDLPVILHTPGGSRSGGRYTRFGGGIAGYERNTSLGQSTVIDAADPAIESVRIDVEAAADAGLPEERLVASHADDHNAPYLAEETDCYLSFTIGTEWLTGVSPRTVAEAVDEYGPDRIMVDSDAANVIRSDPLAIKRAVFELYRHGVDVGDIRQVVYENPREVFGIGE